MLPQTARFSFCNANLCLACSGQHHVDVASVRIRVHGSLKFGAVIAEETVNHANLFLHQLRVMHCFKVMVHQYKLVNEEHVQFACIALGMVLEHVESALSGHCNQKGQESARGDGGRGGIGGGDAVDGGMVLFGEKAPFVPELERPAGAVNSACFDCGSGNRGAGKADVDTELKDGVQVARIANVGDALDFGAGRGEHGARNNNGTVLLWILAQLFQFFTNVGRQVGWQARVAAVDGFGFGCRRVGCCGGGLHWVDLLIHMLDFILRMRMRNGLVHVQVRVCFGVGIDFCADAVRHLFHRNVNEVVPIVGKVGVRDAVQEFVVDDGVDIGIDVGVRTDRVRVGYGSGCVANGIKRNFEVMVRVGSRNAKHGWMVSGRTFVSSLVKSSFFVECNAGMGRWRACVCIRSEVTFKFIF